ncbi:MAG: 6-hydroxymethylpterin diphosphokinase MptE-like protein [Alkalispirochaeta sp.]
MIPDKPRDLFLQEGPDGVQVYLEGRPLLGRAPSLSQRRRVPSSPQQQTLYLVLSPLLGYGLDAFVRSLPRSSAVLAVELDSRLGAIRDQRPPLPDPFRFVVTPEGAVTVAEELVRVRGIRRVETVSLSGGTRLHRSQYARIEAAITEGVERYWRNRGTEIRLGRRWISNIWRNAAIPARSAAEITPPEGILPADGDTSITVAGGIDRDENRNRLLLLGAGPNLDRHLPYLKRLLRDVGTRRPVFVALDTALPALAASGIPVDAVVAMDGQLANATDLVPWRWSDTALFADLTVHPSILRHFPGDRRFLFATRFGAVSFFADREVEPLAGLGDALPILPPRGSVAPAALEILTVYFGFSSIVLAGTDFWYRPPRTHAAMTGGHRAFLRTHTRLAGNDGDPRVMLRPWSIETLPDGRSTPADAILVVQARHLSDTITDLRRRKELSVHRLDGPAIPIGVPEISRHAFREWFVAAEDDVSRFRRRLERLGAPHLRTPHLHEAFKRLSAQERVLADTSRPPFLDAGLEFAWFDLPQWPLAGRSREWAVLQRFRILRAVRDHRRRLGRILSEVTPQDSL